MEIRNISFHRTNVTCLCLLQSKSCLGVKIDLTVCKEEKKFPCIGVFVSNLPYVSEALPT